ncbi:MAG: transcription elongation factor GreB [Polyangiaceae bacterium]|jgi:transcription elongation factor GreB
MIGAAKGPPPPPNYITLAGAKRLQEELGRLRSKERPKVVQEVSDAAAQGDRSENAEYIYGKRRLREIDRRMQFLTRRLEKAVIVEPRTDGSLKIFFGAIVEVEDEECVKATYQIVGEDEIDLGVGRISWRSPLGRALLGKKEDDTIVFRKPSGEVELTILAVRYESPPATE